MFDEPTSYLDVKQRLNAADAIRSVSRSDNYVICVEHDLSVLDYLSDGYDVILEIDINGYKQIKENYPDAVGIFIMPPSVDELLNTSSNKKDENNIIKSYINHKNLKILNLLMILNLELKILLHILLLKFQEF